MNIFLWAPQILIVGTPRKVSIPMAVSPGGCMVGPTGPKTISPLELSLDQINMYMQKSKVRNLGNRYLVEFGK